jgi:hypothetical protein
MRTYGDVGEGFETGGCVEAADSGVDMRDTTM